MCHLLFKRANHSEAAAADQGICFVCGMLGTHQRRLFDDQSICLEGLQERTMCLPGTCIGLQDMPSWCSYDGHSNSGTIIYQSRQFVEPGASL